MKIKKFGKSTRVWVLIDQDDRGKLEMVVMSNDKGSYGIIENVFVKKQHRGKGIASKLVEEAIVLARTKRFYKIVLTCSEDLISFYKALDFEWQEGGQAYCMRIDLNE